MGEILWFLALIGIISLLTQFFSWIDWHAWQQWLTPENYALAGSIVWLIITLILVKSRLESINLVGYTSKWVKWREAPSVPEGDKLRADLDDYYGKSSRLYGQFFSPRSILSVLLAQSALWPVDMVVRPCYRLTVWLATRKLFTSIWKVLTLKGEDK